jgi:tRNA modification GTPase
MEGEIRSLLVDSSRGERLREGLTVAIAGPVNVGKSSILNRLAKRPAAIVSPYAGTTRDVIEVHLDLGGFPVTAIDTAGIRDTIDPVEEEGVRRARSRAMEADLVLWVMDGVLPSPVPPPSELSKPGAPPVWVLVNKMDLAGERSGQVGSGQVGSDQDKGMIEEGAFGLEPTWTGLTQGSEASAPVTQSVPNGVTCRVSAHTGAGFDDLVQGISNFARQFFSEGIESVIVTRQRHRSALTQCADALSRAAAEGRSRAREDIIAEELRLAARALGRLIGKVDVEQVLDVIFRDFCIGK